MKLIIGLLAIFFVWNIPANAYQRTSYHGDWNNTSGYDYLNTARTATKRYYKKKQYVAKKRIARKAALIKAPVVTPKALPPIVNEHEEVESATKRIEDGFKAIEIQVQRKVDLVAKAMRHLGTNPTGWSRVWCGRFMAMIAPEAAKKIPNPNWARNWALLPRVKPQIGAIAVLSRGLGGHVGVVTAFDKNGNPTLISGNHRRKVGIGKYSKHRIIAYVLPS